MATKNAIDSNIPVEVSKGGTGAATLTDHGVLVGSGTGAITPLVVGATGELLVGVTGSDPAFNTSADGDFTFTSSTAAVARVLTVTNTDNTSSSSSARIDVNTGGASAGDPQASFIVNGQQTWSIGIDNDSLDSFKISASSSLGTTDVLKSTTDGEITMPLQPAFGVQAATQSDVTGDGTSYILTFTAAEFFDQNNDFDGTSTFTAPVSGLYQFNAEVFIDDVSASHTDGYITLSTSNRDYDVSHLNPASVKNPSDNCSFEMSLLVDMDASDTAVIKLTISNGAKVIDIITNSYFNGYLAC